MWSYAEMKIWCMARVIAYFQHKNQWWWWVSRVLYYPASVFFFHWFCVLFLLFMFHRVSSIFFFVRKIFLDFPNNLFFVFVNIVMAFLRRKTLIRCRPIFHDSTCRFLWFRANFLLGFFNWKYHILMKLTEHKWIFFANCKQWLTFLFSNFPDVWNIE